MANLTVEQLRKELEAAKAAEKALREQLKAANVVQPHSEIDGDSIILHTGVSSPKRMKLATARVVRELLNAANL